MKKTVVLQCVVLIIGTMFVFCNQNKKTRLSSQTKNESKFSRLTGPYLGQKPPGKTAELFAPDILSTGFHEQRISFTKDGKEVFSSCIVNAPGVRLLLFYSKVIDGRWKEPYEFTYPGGRDNYGRPVISPDGKKLFFHSNRPDKYSDGKKTTSGIWYTERINKDWASPQKIYCNDDIIYKGHPAIASNGNLYFQGGNATDENEDIFISTYKNGSYSRSVRLGVAINSNFHDLHPYIAPDESYLIFDCKKPDGYGQNDIYISFRNKDGDWMEAKNMGQNVNNQADQRRAFVSYDGKYLFFVGRVNNPPQISDYPMTLTKLKDFHNSAENGSWDYYWIDAKVIEELKPKHLK